MTELTPTFVNGRHGSYRISISLRRPVAECLIRMSTDQGRSISNLCAYLLESTLQRLAKEHPDQVWLG